MSIGTVFVNNRTQAVRLPADTRFPDGIKHVVVRVLGAERIISPAEHSWDSFFLGGASVTEDFMPERAEQIPTERESF
jgi:antitoxin VapB